MRESHRPDDYCPPGAPLVGDDHDLGPRSTWRGRGITDWVIWFTYGGACRVAGPGATVISGAGEAILIAPGTPHDYGSAPGAKRWAVQWIVFRAPARWLEWLQWPSETGTPGISCLRFTDPVVRDAFRERLVAAIAIASSGHAQREELAMNALEGALLWCAAARSGAAIDARLLKAQRYLNERLDRAVPLDEVATAAGLSRPQVARLFRRHVGTSVARWHEEQRLDRARQLLRATDLPVAAIAERVGYANAFHFTARFTRRTGRSPRAYRRG